MKITRIDFLRDRFVFSVSFINLISLNIFKSKYGKNVYSKNLRLVSVNNSNSVKPNVNNNIVIPDINEDDFIIVDNIIIITEINTRDCE